MDGYEHDEFELLPENAQEFALPWSGPPAVSRVGATLGDGRTLSALRWGDAEPEVVLIHGGAQNAHTWDTVALALCRPLLAVDMPGHGHSSWRDDHAYTPASNAEDIAVALGALAPSAQLVVGMSLGGLTAICLASRHPDLVRRLAVVDVTPGTDHVKAEPIIAFVSGPERFASFDEMLARTIEFNPTRSVASLRRGVLHNARPEPDGSWAWRYDRLRPSEADGTLSFTALWDDVARIRVPALLLRGALSHVVSDEDVEQWCRLLPGTEVVTVDGAGHSIQGDRPLELAAHLEALLRT